MPDHLPLIEFALHHHSLVTIVDVRRLGISDDRWRAMRREGFWVAVSPSHYRHSSTPETFDLRVRAGLGWLGKESAMFGATSLSWMDVDVDQPLRPEFVVPRQRRSLVSGLEVHTTTAWEPVDLTRHRGLRTTTAARAIIDMAGCMRNAAAIERAIDSAVRARRTSLPTLRDRVSALEGRGRSGCALLRELLLDSGGESYLERRFLQLMRKSGIPPPRCQVAFTASTAKPIRVDFLFGAVVVEVSGRLGHSSGADRQRAGRRKFELEEQGFRVVEFTTADVIDDPDYVVSTVRRSLV